MKKIAVLLLVLALMLGMSSASIAEEKEGGFIYGASLQTLNGAFHLALKAGIEAGVAEIDPEGTCIILGADKEPDLQVDQFEDLIAKGCDVILVDPVDSGSIKTALLAAAEAGIPVVNIDSGVDDKDLVIASDSSDNYQAGKIAAEKIVEALGGKGNVAVLSHPSVEACKLRADAFYDVIADYSDIKVVADLNFSGNTDTAQNMVETVLMAYPDLAAVFCIADCGAYGAVAAAKANDYNPGDIKITGVDGEQVAADYVKEGWMLGTSAQDANELGYMGIELGYAYLTGVEFQVDNLVETLFVDAEVAKTYVGF